MDAKIGDMTWMQKWELVFILYCYERMSPDIDGYIQKDFFISKGGL
jgi:hypothetical protein